MLGIVYCLVNQAMPEYVKIGVTENLDERLRQLDNTSTPLPFECAYAVEVENPQVVERLVHQTFAEQRTRPNREFFEVAVPQVIAALRLTGGLDVTPTESNFEDEDSRSAVERTRSKRSRFNFEMVGVPVGSTLRFTDDEEISCVVASSRTVNVDGREMSLSAAAGDVMEQRGLGRTVQGPAYWLFEGETLHERRIRLESEG